MKLQPSLYDSKESLRADSGLFLTFELDYSCGAEHFDLKDLQSTDLRF
jgi:hypothetical protein